MAMSSSPRSWVSGVIHVDRGYDDDDNKITEQEIKDLANKLSRDWMEIGFELGYHYHQLTQLEEMYQTAPVRRNIEMLSRWYEVVCKQKLNAKILLASHFKNCMRNDLAEYLIDSFEGISVPDIVKKKIGEIIFDRPTAVKGIVLNQTHVTINIHLPGNPNDLRVCPLDSFMVELSTEIDSRTENVDPCRDLNAFGSSRIESRQESDSDTETDLNAFGSSRIESRQESDSDTETDLNTVGSSRQDTHPDMHKGGDLVQLIHEMSLDAFYPVKITLQDVRAIQYGEMQRMTKDKIPWLVLNKIIMLNQNAREIDLSTFYEQTDKSGCEILADDSDDLYGEIPTCSMIHPTDLIYAIFVCCDMILKKEVICKMFTCRLAIPLIYKDHNNQIVFSQWCLKNILISTSVDGKTCQVDALNHKAKRVAFIRMGRPKLSKSKLLNELLGAQDPQTFYNRDCTLGTITRQVANGMVEASWYVSSSPHNCLFEETIMFMNLRGDGTNFLKELQIVCDISQVVVIHTDVVELTNSTVINLLSKIHKTNLTIIYTLEQGDANEIVANKILKDYKSHMEQFKRLMIFFNLMCSRPSRSSADVSKRLRKLLNNATAQLPCSSLAETTIQLEISDEKTTANCLKSKEMALEVFKTIDQKHIVLPLQGKLWQQWCMAFKTMSRTKSDDEKINLLRFMDEKLQDQRAVVESKIHPFVRSFVENLERISKTEIDFYIAWVMIYLDEKSRSVIPQLISNYNKSWLDLKTTKENRNSVKYDTLHLQVEIAEKELVAASFGLEHLIRELGQIYQASHDSRSIDVGMNINRFPKIVSKLIQNGHPFEIMDGDTAMVPLKWVNAVFEQLKRDLKDERVFAISVLGIQSSGKSTLLNAMFGLHFPVSAGRCTRGVYMQLVKVSNNRLPFAYILVFDTEGLRASELADKKHMHDNELATFVLGLGNITIINIKGENTAEMQDVLQIAVHAFLRLKMANDKLQLQQTCIFVHQNVSASDAITAMTHSRQKLMDELDKMTCVAASQEGLADISSFSQVIKIDPQSHMWYFPDLWHGDPPMATINLSYSREVAKVKQHLLFDIATKKQTVLSFTETLSRIGDLWNGILSDDFVFNFRNSLEMKAYNMVEQKVVKLTLELDVSMHNFIMTEARTPIARCNNEGDLKRNVAQINSKLDTCFAKQHEHLVQKWNNFIESSSLCAIMEQWRERRTNEINEHVRDSIRTGKKRIKKIQAQYAMQIEKKKHFTKELEKKAQDLLVDSNEAHLPSSVLDELFRSEWEKLICDLEDEDQEKCCTSTIVHSEIKDVLYELFATDKPLLAKALQNVETNDSFLSLNTLHNSFTIKDLQDGDISFPSDVHNNTQEESDRCRQLAIKIIDVLFGRIHTHLSNWTSEDISFEKTQARTAFMEIIDTFQEHNSENEQPKKFKFTATLRVKIAVHIFKVLAVELSKLNDRYEEKNSIKAQMADYRFSSWVQFQNKYGSKPREQIIIRNVHFVEKHVKILLKTMPMKNTHVFNIDPLD